MQSSDPPYDVAIVGAGPAGLLAAVAALRARPDLRLLLVDAGPDLVSRVSADRGGEQPDPWSGFGGQASL